MLDISRFMTDGVGVKFPSIIQKVQVIKGTATAVGTQNLTIPSSVVTGNTILIISGSVYRRSGGSSAAVGTSKITATLTSGSNIAVVYSDTDGVPDVSQNYTITVVEFINKIIKSKQIKDTTSVITSVDTAKTIIVPSQIILYLSANSGQDEYISYARNPDLYLINSTNVGFTSFAGESQIVEFS